MKGDVLMNLFTTGVMNGMLGSSSCMKAAEVSMRVYSEAKNKGDEKTMNRALGYANDSKNSAMENSKKASKSLEEAQIEAKEQAKKEQQMSLNEKAQKKQKIPVNSKHTDSVVISNNGKSAAQTSAKITEVSDTASQADMDISGPPVNTSSPGDKIYTAKGDIIPANVETKLSVSV